MREVNGLLTVAEEFGVLGNFANAHAAAAGGDRLTTDFVMLGTLGNAHTMIEMVVVEQEIGGRAARVGTGTPGNVGALHKHCHDLAAILDDVGIEVSVLVADLTSTKLIWFKNKKHEIAMDFDEVFETNF